MSQECYVPFLMKKKVRAAVFVIFYGWLCSSLAVLPRVEVGLDQELSMPEDSYVLKYFQVGYFLLISIVTLKIDFL
jgi:Niemann-Pick C1 protein